MARNSDLPTRAATAVAMVAVTGLALWIGGMVWVIFVLAAGVGVWFEWRTLVHLFTAPGARRNVWSAAGAIYCGIAAAMLMVLRDHAIGGVLMVVLTVAAVDVGAYFAGRTIGGPRILPSVSPGKTWAGFVGGWLCASLVLYLLLADGYYDGPSDPLEHWWLGVLRGWKSSDSLWMLVLGFAIASIAQAGDFFESWMKRRAGVKDSGTLLPGHGGLFDRLDGLLAVLFIGGLLLPLFVVHGDI